MSTKIKSSNAQETVVSFSLNTILLETFVGCTRKCSFCAWSQEHELPNKGKYMSDETLTLIAKQLSKMKYQNRISPYHINEPLLDKRLPDIIALFRKSCPASFISINTNGDRLTDSVIKALREAGISAIGISIYDQEAHNRLSPFQDLYPYVKLIDMRSPIGKLDNRAGSIQDSNFGFPPVTSLASQPCLRPFTMMVFKSNGDAILCCNDMYGEVVLGNIHQEPIHKIWHSEKLNSYRQTLLSQGREQLKLCANCTFSGEGSLREYPLYSSELSQ